jgi:hypothetical protein
MITRAIRLAARKPSPKYIVGSIMEYVRRGGCPVSRATLWKPTGFVYLPKLTDLGSPRRGGYAFRACIATTRKGAPIQAPCWWTRTIDVSIVCTAAS